MMSRSFLLLGRFLPVFTTFGLVAAALVCWLAAPSIVRADDTTPPTTYLNLSGTLGGSGWYVSTVDVNLRASDLQSGPASTTYQIDSNPPVTNTFTSGSNAVLNPSFEDGVYPILNNWDKVTSDPSRLAQSNLPAKFGYCSARVQPISTEFDYWTNRNAYIPASAGSSYSTSTWIMTSGLTATAGQGAWFEVWAMDSTNTNSDVKLAASTPLTGDNDWTLESLNFTLPAGYDGIYLRLGAQGSAGNAWFDGVSLYTGTDAITQFTMVQNGIHSMTYSSTDNAGNVEPNNTYSPIKIDTADPQDWNGFDYTNTGNAHTWTMWVYVRDITSGINPASAQFRTYDVNNCDCWSAWTNQNASGQTLTVTNQSDGSTTQPGYTGFVKITVPSVDYGDNSSSNTPKVEFRINDIAHSDPDQSPIYALFGPWVQMTGGADIYSKGDITISGASAPGQFASDGIVMTDGTISNMDTSTNWYIYPYAPPQGDTQSISTYLTQYPRLLATAAALPGNKMPSTSGVYKYTGNYTIDNNSLTSSFQGGALNAVIIIDGNLTINQNYSLNAASAVLFIVTGNVVFNGSVTKSEGLILAAGSVNTNAGTNQLVHKGAMVGLNGIILGRDLGRKGNPSNADTAAELIQYQAKYLANTGFAQLVTGTDSSFTWQEGP